MRQIALLTLPMLALTACDPKTAPSELASLQFNVTSAVGPCVASLRVRFDVDGVVIGEENFNVHKQPLRSLSLIYQVPEGTHTIGAKLMQWDEITFSGPSESLWPDTLMTLVAGQGFVRTVDLYCS
jgi:hypothetical protein